MNKKNTASINLKLFINCFKSNPKKYNQTNNPKKYPIF